MIGCVSFYAHLLSRARKNSCSKLKLGSATYNTRCRVVTVSATFSVCPDPCVLDNHNIRSNAIL